MRENKKAPEEQKVAAKKPSKATERDAHEYETMSQRQNRYGNGRERNGSDGSNQVRGSNH